MSLEEVASVMLGVYSASPLITALMALNLLISLLIARKLIGFAIKMHGKSLSIALRYLAYSFLIVALISIIQLLSAFPWFDWALVEQVAFLIFLLAVYYSVMHITETVRAYSHIKISK